MYRYRPFDSIYRYVLICIESLHITSKYWVQLYVTLPNNCLNCDRCDCNTNCRYPLGTGLTLALLSMGSHTCHSSDCYRATKYTIDTVLAQIYSKELVFFIKLERGGINSRHLCGTDNVSTFAHFPLYRQGILGIDAGLPHVQIYPCRYVYKDFWRDSVQYLYGFAVIQHFVHILHFFQQYPRDQTDRLWCHLTLYVELQCLLQISFSKNYRWLIS